MMLRDLFNNKKGIGNNMEKVNLFKQLLKEKEIGMESSINEDGVCTFVTHQSIKNGPTMRLVAMFNAEETSVYCYVFDYLNIGEEKKERIIDAINAINSNYTFTTFYLSDDLDIQQKYSIDIEDVYSPVTVFNQLIIMIHHAEEQYKEFMKIVWSD
jgi:hypothetical protein